MITSLSIVSRATGLNDDEEKVLLAMLRADPTTLHGSVARLSWARLLEILSWPDANTHEIPFSRDRLLIALGRLVHRTAPGGKRSRQQRPLPVFALMQNETSRKATTCQLAPAFLAALNGVATRCDVAAY